MRHFKVAAIAAVVVMSAAASPAWAGVECKTDQIIGAGPPGGTDQDAKDSWSAIVTSQFDASWANVSLSQNQTTDQGMMDPELLYEPPFTGIAPTGPEHLFDDAKVVRLVTTIRAINDSAVA